jgi:hypothetical protein
MKTIGLMLVVSAGLSAAEMTGYISDSFCGAKNANPSKESADCAKACLKNGAEPVFVADADQKVYKIANKAAVAKFGGAKVTIEGDAKEDTITVKSVKAAS